ncbi:hypothetical protein AWB81_08275 [Caballeronia arationis]|jgi:hypothetical protein|uniref:Uncharacterized protein n=1 Tax=Caballeronia arationis TaxID=1777142 RepID=A0A7Z7I3G3_9BURK|nr:hypothetical protein AWB81_08275 [Caballeronia arationis]SOE56589.1 hypothetical protein SAMN05446927_1279 [Caballeronia arationis]
MFRVDWSLVTYWPSMLFANCSIAFLLSWGVLGPLCNM